MHDIPTPGEQTPAVTNDQNNLDRPRGWGIRSTDQVTVAVFTGVAIALVAASWVYRGGLRGRLIDIESAPPAQVTFQLDINSAEWPEWTLLPGVGETLAKRIVQNRDEQGRFRSHEDVGRVNGIGPRTIERMRAYLLPLSEEGDRTEQELAAHR
ncbi:MAG: helix-hairpin-helix domain-containing protein [Planctomycetes bacterium]|nr:helix-hairpin-helix domain-containing protein [Planctomycetota bacterium]